MLINSFYPHKGVFTFYSILILSVLWSGCNQLSKKERIKAAAEEKKETPALTPRQSMEKMRLEDGFDIELVASEPLISSPVAMAFDDSLRLWVVEMRSFKPIMDNLKEPLPSGRIIILEDSNDDGKMDSRKVFMDSLKAPRAIYLDHTGVLLATPPNLWYIENNNDKPGKKTLVDSTYTVTNNTEGQTNGLFRSLDNWIYSAGFGSNKRYRKIEGKWHKEPTRLRGQWGISQDNFGRMFYNHHSTQLMGDYFMPGLVDTNRFQEKVVGYNELVVSDQKVYPAGPTPGVTEALHEGMLDEDLKLQHFTAASGPVIYRGSLFGNEHNKNAFVAEPAGNLIKRNILQEEGYKISGQQAYKEKEFLASTDERFRPVTLKNGPDGGLYIVDMYRGVIQDSMWVTPYLKKYSLNRNLDQPINTGRIYKVVPENEKASMVSIPDDVNKLVDLLGSHNGWVRDKAQKKLVEEKYKNAIPLLKEVLHEETDPLQTVHALWSLQGLNALEVVDITPLLSSNDKRIQKQAINAIGAIINKKNYQTYIPVVRKIISKKDSLTAPNIAYLVNRFQGYNPKTAKGFISDLLSLYPKNKFVADAVINGLGGQEKAYLEQYPDTSKIFSRRLSKVLKKKESNKNKKNAKKNYPAGFAKYESLCMTCHGVNGGGIKSLGPPLNRSEWVEGKKNKIIAIVFNGLKGPVKVKGKIYKKPETSGQMPSFKSELSDKDAAGLINYLRHAWDNDATNISENDVSIIRTEFKDRDKPFTAEELHKIFNK